MYVYVYIYTYAIIYACILSLIVNCDNKPTYNWAQRPEDHAAKPGAHAREDREEFPAAMPEVIPAAVGHPSAACSSRQT